MDVPVWRPRRQWCSAAEPGSERSQKRRLRTRGALGLDEAFLPFSKCVLAPGRQRGPHVAAKATGKDT